MVGKFAGYLSKLKRMVFLHLTQKKNLLVNHFHQQERKEIQEAFGNIPVFVINLKKNPKRFKRTVKNLHKMGLKNVIRFEAIEDVIGLRGCTKSHLQLWRQLYTSNSEIAFICEDDIRFIGSIRLLKQVLWDTLVLEDVQMVCLANYTSEEGIFRTRNLRFSSKVQAAAIYLVKRNFLPKLIPYGEKSILELTESQGKTGSIDKVWMRLQVQNPFAIPVKKICIQYYGHSDIRKKRSFYTH